MIKYRTTCRSCNHTDLKPIIDLGKQAIQGSFIYPDKPKPPIRAIDSTITICNVLTGGCGLIQNLISIAPEILYSNYGYRSSISVTMRNHLDNIVDSILHFVKSNNIVPARVLDIGANDLYMLKQYPTEIERVGVDPSNIINEVDPEGIQTINDCYPSQTVNGSFDIISSIACFYDIEDPTNFCKEIKRALTDDGVWVVEFAYLPAVYSNLAYDGMVHEHLCLYSIANFEHILKRTGLKILRLQENDTNGGSLQAWIVKEENVKFNSSMFQKHILELKIKEFQMGLENPDTYVSFMRRVVQHKEALVSLLRQLKADGKNIHVYGMAQLNKRLRFFCFLLH